MSPVLILINGLAVGRNNLCDRNRILLHRGLQPLIEMRLTRILPELPRGEDSECEIRKGQHKHQGQDPPGREERANPLLLLLGLGGGAARVIRVGVREARMDCVWVRCVWVRCARMSGISRGAARVTWLVLGVALLTQWLKPLLVLSVRFWLLIRGHMQLGARRGGRAISGLGPYAAQRHVWLIAIRGSVFFAFALP